MKSIPSLQRRFLQIPLFYKILLANSAIVTVGAVAGTIITVWHVIKFPDDIHYELIVFFLVVGVLISFLVNKWVLKRALAPLDRLQDAVDSVRAGHTQVRFDPGSASDERFDRLADTFNQMLARLEEDARIMQHLSRQIIHAQEEERRRLARELHDEAAQALTSLLVRLRLLERAKSPEKAQEGVEELRALTAQALEEVRRVALDLRPTILDDLGLGPALEWRVDEFNRCGQPHATLRITGLDQRLPPDVELAFYRIGQECLSNITRHAEAKQVAVALRKQEDCITLEVSDDGCGFDPGNVQTDYSHGMGLLGMRERMGMIGGQLHIESTLGVGTRILAKASVTCVEDLPLPLSTGSFAAGEVPADSQPSADQPSLVQILE